MISRSSLLLLIGFLFLFFFFNILLTYFHLTNQTISLSSSSSSSLSLPFSSKKYQQTLTSKFLQLNRNKSLWLESFYLSLQDEILLTRNVRSKEHLWHLINQSSDFYQENGEILVFLGWVAYWVMISFFLFDISLLVRLLACLNSIFFKIYSIQFNSSFFFF